MPLNCTDMSDPHVYGGEFAGFGCTSPGYMRRSEREAHKCHAAPAEARWERFYRRDDSPVSMDDVGLRMAYSARPASDRLLGLNNPPGHHPNALPARR